MQNIYLEEFLDKNIDLYKNYLGFYINGEVYIGEHSEPSLENPYNWSFSTPCALEFYNHMNVVQFLKNNEKIEGMRNEIAKWIKLYERVNDKTMIFKRVIPISLLKEYYEELEKEVVKINVPEGFFNSQEFYFKVRMKNIIYSISERKLNLENNIRNNRDRVYYNQYNVTARFSDSHIGFPIMSFPKNQRKHILPNNDLFFNVDMNAADPSVFMLFYDKQIYNEYKEDLYEYFRIKMNLPKSIAREQLKKETFEVLYSEKIYDFLDSKKLYEKIDALLEEKDGNYYVVDNIGRRHFVKSTKHIFPYIFQSNSSNVINEFVIKVYDFLKQNNMESEICFTIHDSFVVDVVEREFDDIIYFINENKFSEIEDTELSYKYEIGQNFGEMIKI